LTYIIYCDIRRRYRERVRYRNPGQITERNIKLLTEK